MDRQVAEWLHERKDGVCRAADIRTKGGIKTRAIQRLYNLEISRGIEEVDEAAEEGVVEVQQDVDEEPVDVEQEAETAVDETSGGGGRPVRKRRLPQRYGEFDMT